MIDILQMAEKELKFLLSKPEIWHTLDVDYYPPRVERLWCEYGPYRLCIHYSHFTNKPCLFHKHRWPAAFKLIEGSYEMGLTYCESELTSEEVYKLPYAKLILNKGSYYEMTDTHLAHYIKPIGGHSISLMLSGKLYAEAIPTLDGNYRKEVIDRELLALSDDRKFTLLQYVNHII